ncbi:hypothetical protein J4E08_00520 [Sagittula sp. NFXS13]|uniref:hypothetical protein n=1 Tax=Sagittula sp. NFXS13 TaxID=2819095 RepID=UPI0032DFAF0D
MTLRTLAAVALLALPVAASAETVTLASDMSGATVHSATVDMSVYWTDKGDAYELTAIYASRTDAEDTGRLVMALTDGDSVSFGLPGHVGQMFTFARQGDAVNVVADASAPALVAMN